MKLDSVMNFGSLDQYGQVLQFKIQTVALHQRGAEADFQVESFLLLRC